MSTSIVYTRARLGLDAPQVTVEVHITGGLPRFSIVGLPEASVRESRERVRSAIMNSGFDFPAKRITVNLAPAELPKQGGRFDLPIAIGILAASAQLPSKPLGEHELLGELGLEGSIRATTGVLPACLHAHKANRTIIVPAANGEEAALTKEGRALSATNLGEVCAHLCGRTTLSITFTDKQRCSKPREMDLADIHGQHHAKRALEVAAAGAHHLLLYGPPGAGKTMLATRLPALLPDMTETEALSSASVYSVSGAPLDLCRWLERPFRAPHHTASGVALVGGGSNPKPGEISLAHHGVLFLDELPEFERRVLEVLREPMESKCINISRAARQVQFPADFQLVAAMNPCPCGWLGDRSGRCRCTEDQAERYQSRVSGPLLDRIDLHVAVPPLDPRYFHDDSVIQGESSATVRTRVVRTRHQQLDRAGKLNRDLSSREVERDCKLQRAERDLLHKACERLGLSARAWFRILKVARTIADLDRETHIGTEHLSEAISFRSLERARR